MGSIAQQEAEDLARSLPWEESTSWDGAVYMVVAFVVVFWLLSRDDEAQLPTFLEVERSRDTTKKRINPWLALGEFYAVVLLANWLSQWGIWLGLVVYLLGSGLILWQAWWIYHKE